MQSKNGEEGESDTLDAKHDDEHFSFAAAESARVELLAYYAYNGGNNSLTHLTFGAAAFQNLLDRASDADGYLFFAGSRRDVEDVVLFASALSFTLQSILFVFLGGYADFGTLRPKLLLFWSVLAFATAFAWLGVYTPEDWRASLALYILGRLTYEMTLVYWTAAFPLLARDSPTIRTAAAALASGKISPKQFETADMIERSRISNVAFCIQSFSAVFVLAIIDISLGYIDLQSTPALKSKGLSYIIAFTGVVWLVVAVPWFFIEKKRPGQKVPEDMSLMRAGIWQIQQAASKIWLLKQSLIYLVCFFMLESAINSSYTVFSTMQYDLIGFNMVSICRLYMIGLSTQGAGIYVFWWFQQKAATSTKTMLGYIIVAGALMNAWGLIGNFTTSFGFHNLWEAWLWQAYFGFFVCPWYSYSLIMISSVTPRGYESMFFSLFGIASKVSLLVGHFVNSAVVHAATGDYKDWAPFYLLFALTILSGIGFWIFVDEDASIAEQRSFLAAKEKVLHSESAYHEFELSNLVPDSERSSMST